jgi:iron complex outermembrane receptor protein
MTSPFTKAAGIELIKKWSGVAMRISVALAMCCLCTLSFAADPAHASIRRDANIPAEPLGAALQDLAKVYELQLLYHTEIATGLKTQGAVGSLTSDEALTKVLSGTGLSYKFLDSNTITVYPQSPSQAAAAAGSDSQTMSSKEEGRDKKSQDFRVAQVDQGTAGPQAVGDDQNADKKKKKEEGLSEIVVTGSRIPTAAGQQTLPVRSYTREDIENSGQTTMGEFLNTLPDVSNFTNSSLQLGVGGVQTVQLHGLPVGTTLTLLDGRRLESSALGFFDLSNIPLAAVERVEILPVGASSIYGADGLGGAVNTILRKDFNGFEANAALDQAPGVSNPSFNIAWGKSWDRGSVSLIGTYQERGALLGTQREPTSSTQLPSYVTAAQAISLGNDSCVPGNVYSTDGVSNLPGLSSPNAAIPAGITGTPTIGQFAATAGKLNVCNSAAYRDITPESQREGALLSAHYNVGESMDLFTEVLFSHGHLRDQEGPQISVSQGFGGTVAANNPYNPFGEAVNVSFEYPGTGLVLDESTSFFRPLIGVRGSFLTDWHYEATAYFSRDRLDYGYSYTDGQLISNALASPNPATALNPFASGAPGTSQLLNSLTNPAVDSSDVIYDDRIVGAQGILRGPLFQLPAGAVQAVIGGEYSQEKQDTTVVQSPPPLLLQRNTYAVFSEARVPLLGGGQPSQRSERLALTLAGRYDHSNDYGGKATWQSGLLWRATDTLSFRGGYGLSYQAPRLLEISGPQFVTADPFGIGVADPFRGNQLVSYPLTVVSGPNFHLKPETGDSFTLGLEYSSQALPGLHTSLTWYDVKITNYIGPESYQALLAYPNLFPGAVTRAPASAQDQAQGFLGPITQLNSEYYNFGDLRVAGFDADASYAIDTRLGQFTPSVAIANIYKWQSALVPGAPTVDAVSQATFNGVGWSPRWKGTAALAWKQGPLSMNVAGRYIGKYLDYQDLGVPNTNEIGNTWIFDFNARYEVGQALASTNPWLAKSYVAFGAVNLLNKTPPFSYTPFWYDFEEYDIRGRYFHLNAGVRF